MFVVIEQFLGGIRVGISGRHAGGSKKAGELCALKTNMRTAHFSMNYATN